MYAAPHYVELKKYVGRKEFQDEDKIYPLTDKLEAVHRAHFRITEQEKEFLEKTASILNKSVNDLSVVLIEKMLPLIETQVFRTVDEMEEHYYNVGGYQIDLFVTMAEETFFMLQYLKETLHFYSYCEVFRFVVDFFMDEYSGERIEEDEIIEKIYECIDKIERECQEWYSEKRKVSTIVPSILRKIRATKGCLFQSGQIYLQKMLI